MRIYPFIPWSPNLDKINDIDKFIGTAKANFNIYWDAKQFETNNKQSIVIYQISLNGVMHTGLVCALAISDIKNGAVIKHENTLSSKEVIMLNLIKERQAHIKPVLLSMRREKVINKWIVEQLELNRTKVYTLKKDEIHYITEVSDADAIAKMVKIFEAIPESYIADGHHRCYSALRLINEDKKKYDRILTSFFAFDEIEIYPYQRILSISSKYKKKEIFRLLSTHLDWKPIDNVEVPTKRSEIRMFYHKQWYTATWSKAHTDKLDGSGLDLFNEFILGDVMSNTDHEVLYVQGDTPIKKIVKQAAKEDFGIAFLFAPLTFRRLKKTLDARQILAPKSTYFVPRMRNGLIVQKI